LAATIAEPPAPPLPHVRPHLLQDVERAQLWQRLREGFALPDLDTGLVQKWEQWYARDPAYVQRMAERSGRYLFHVVEEVQRRGLPTELALLPFIESGFNPQALSRAAASGMWQFMPDTGTDFELRQNVFRDDRRDVLASTRAALDYLQQLHGMFGDWRLALAAYNWGQGNLTRAIARNQRAGLATDYLSLGARMPQETREYVPKLQAIENIVVRPEDFGLSLPELGDQPYFLSVPIERDIDVALVARLAGMSIEEFKQLNPQLNKPLILAAGTPQVLLPYDNANRFIAGLSQHEEQLASWTAWVAPRNLSAAQAAGQLGIGEDELRELNHIPKRMLIKRGSTLLVPRAAHAEDVAEHIADHGTLALVPDLPPLRRLYFRAGRKGDSVVAVARRYRVNATQLAQWNGLRIGGRFKAGQRIVVMLPATKSHPARPGAKLVKGKRVKARAVRSTRSKAAPRAPRGAAATKERAAQKAPRSSSSPRPAPASLSKAGNEAGGS
jgi:membrane-bound lytic murein transglycosylase D